MRLPDRRPDDSHYYAMNIPIIREDQNEKWLHLRGYQRHTVNGVRLAFYQGCRAVLLVLPAGGGKTFSATYMIYQAKERKRKTLILVHRQELVNQFSAALTLYGVKHGLVLAEVEADTSHDVLVASVQTFANRMGKMDWEPGLIISDEAHHVTEGSQWGKVIDFFPNALNLGLTATPIRLDGKGLGIGHGGYFDAIVEGPQPGELMELGNLCEYKIFAPSSPPDMKGVKRNSKTGDFGKKAAEERVNKPTITGDAIAHYTKHAPGRPAVVFCMSRKHAADVCERFNAAGYRFAVLDGTLDKETRAGRVAALASGELHGVVTVDLVSEGFDLPALEVAISLRPTQSESLWIQQIARALRPADGKPYAVILDHVGNSSRHGFPDDEREWSLEGRKKTKRAANDEPDITIKQCDVCGHVHRPGPTQCPECGTVYEVQSRPVKEVAGELAEIDAKARKRERQKRIDAAKTLPELMLLASEFGFKPGWARQKHQQKMAAAQGKYRRPGPLRPPVSSYT